MLGFILLLNFTIRSQDCLKDTIVPVIICKDSVILKLGWCGNGSIYPEVFAEKITDNCSLQSVSFDQEGKIQELELTQFLAQFGNINVLSIYARDSSGNVGTCPVLFKVSDETFHSTIPMNLQVLSEFWTEDYSLFKMGIQGEHQTTYWNAFNGYTGSKLSIPVYNYLDPKQFLTSVNEQKNPERSLITSYDLLMTIRHITGIHSFGNTINKLNADMNEDGSVDIRDVKAQYDHILHWSPTDPVYKPKYRAQFVDTDGIPIGDSILYSSNTNEIYRVSLDQKGNINRSIPFYQNISQEPVSQFTGIQQYWNTKDIECKQGQKYNLRFTLSDSSYLFAIQSGFLFHPEYIKVDSVFVPQTYSGKFYSKILPQAVRTVFLNTSNPKITSQFPEFNVAITAQKNFNLSDAFYSINTDMSNLKINYDGQINPVAVKFNRLKQAAAESADIQKINISPNPSQGHFHISGYFPHSDEIELLVFDVFSNNILHKKIRLLSGYLDDNIYIEQEGLYYLVFKKGQQYLERALIVVQH